MKIFNTLSGQKEEFRPSGDVVKMYVCGITPYDECHLGHAMSYIIFDVLRRYLEFKGYRVKHVQNFTDIDDKIISRAKAFGLSPRELADRYISQYFSLMDALNIKRAHFYPKVTEEIPEIINMIQGLIEKGYAYKANGDVYFRVRSFPRYGKLSNRSLEWMMAGARVEAGENKEYPLDFALWKKAKPEEPFWESPWGPGRPGWHIECSAMSLKYLGQTLDIHGGGQDLIFPHHENEIAQSESFTGTTFVRYFVHNGLLRLGEEKMSKSLGNIITLREALARFSPDAIRLFVLSSHYRSPLTYSEEALMSAEEGVERLRLASYGVTGVGRGRGIEAEVFYKRFIEAMDDDLNTPQAIAVLFDLAREINRAKERGLDVEEGKGLLRELASVLGFTLKEERPTLPIEPFIELLVSIRQQLRERKEYPLSDAIRSRLRELGVVLEDTPKGTIWRYKKTKDLFQKD